MSKKLRRSNDAVLGGVCGGLANYFDLDVSLVRIGYLIVSLLSVAFPGVLVYIILWIVVPRD